MLRQKKCPELEPAPLAAVCLQAHLGLGLAQPRSRGDYPCLQVGSPAGLQAKQQHSNWGPELPTPPPSGHPASAAPRPPSGSMRSHASGCCLHRPQTPPPSRPDSKFRPVTHILFQPCLVQCGPGERYSVLGRGGHHYFSPCCKRSAWPSKDPCPRHVSPLPFLSPLIHLPPCSLELVSKARWSPLQWLFSHSRQNPISLYIPQLG